jgi:hypothetical protein
MVSRQAIYSKRRYAEDPEYRKEKIEYGRAYRAAHKDKLNARRQGKPGEKLKRLYGLSPEGYQALMEAGAPFARSAGRNPSDGSQSIIVTYVAWCVGSFARNVIPASGCTMTIRTSCGPLERYHRATNITGRCRGSRRLPPLPFVTGAKALTLRRFRGTADMERFSACNDL